MVLICANYQRYGDVRSNHEDMGKIVGIQWGHIDIYIYIPLTILWRIGFVYIMGTHPSIIGVYEVLTLKDIGDIGDKSLVIGSEMGVLLAGLLGIMNKRIVGP